MHTVTVILLEYDINNMLTYEILAYLAGFIIVLAGVPIRLLSKLQTEIALSSTEAEYIALSQCCRALLSM
jgi:hypothetical protein